MRSRLVLALLVFLCAESAQAQPSPKRKVHIIVSGLTDSNVGPSVKANINQVKQLLEAGLAPHHRGAFIVLEGKRINSREIISAVDSPKAPSRRASLTRSFIR